MYLHGIDEKPLSQHETITKLDFFTLSEAKGLCPNYRILRCAQNDRGGDASFAIVPRH